MEVFEQTGKLTVMRCWCGVQHAVPENLADLQRRKFNNGEKPFGIFCPLGHEHVPAGEPEFKKIERELQRERARHDQTRASLENRTNQLMQKERRLRSVKGVVTRTKNRIAKGKCPCCHSEFSDLKTHMTNAHPSYGQES